MQTDKGKLTEAVDQLAMQTMMLAGADDIMALGAILEGLEGIDKIGAEDAGRRLSPLCPGLKTFVEKIVLQEIPDLEEGLNILREGVRLLQGKISCSEGPSSAEEEACFWNRIKPIIGEVGPAPSSPGKKEETKPDLPREEKPDLSQDLEIYRAFVSEGMEHLEAIELNIIALEQSPQDRECINAIFRPFHSIKGVAGFLNLQEIHKFSHAVESLLDDARNNQLCIDQGVIDLILEAVDFLRNRIQELQKQLEDGALAPSQYAMEPLLRKINLLREKEGEKDHSGNGNGGQPVPVEKGAGRASMADSGTPAILMEQEAGKAAPLEGKAPSRQNPEAPRETNRPARAEAVVKVDTVKLDNLVDLVGELVIAQSLVQQNPKFSSLQDPKLNRDFSQLKRITTDLQKISTSMRMIPIRQTFQKMIRLVRDLAKKSGKQVELVMSGEETEIDRNMVDMLYDPLVHMIRNSIDHGIETAEKRREAAKPELGRIDLRAFQKGGYIVIEIEDDGQGLNRTKITQKAQEKGLISPGTVLNEYQTDNLIFEPGFSTADKVTDVSGRGVGMDVVKRTIEQLRGKVEIFSSAGKGCRFVIRVPLTLAIMDGILVQIGGDRYIIPTVFIRETVRPNRDEIFTVQACGEMIKVRDTLLPLVRLYNLLQIVPRNQNPWEALVVVVENEGYQRGLIVDDLIGRQEVVIKNLGEKFNAVKGIGGATIMGDGRVGLILDIQGIFEIAQADGHKPDPPHGDPR